MNKTIVIFGATGDLTHRKLIPALYNLYRKGRLTEGFRIVGFASHDLDRTQRFARIVDSRCDANPS